ncbi:MAG: hypothetical protein IJ343_06635 [Clostridia bacterium]|nr:hypothetical protein [Clostridia bacterium]
MGFMDLFGRKNTPVQRQRPPRGAGLTTEQLRTELVTLRHELGADFVMYVESTFEIPGRGTALHGWLTGNFYLHVSEGKLQAWQNLNTIVSGIGPVAIEDGTGLIGRAEAGDSLLSINVLITPQYNPERLHGALYIGNGKLSAAAQARQGYNIPRPEESAPAAQPVPRPAQPAQPAPATQAAPVSDAQQQVKIELINALMKRDLMFVMKVVSAVNGRMGTVITGLLMGKARKGGNTAYVVQSGTGQELHGDMEVLGLKRDGVLTDMVDAKLELFNCAVLVPTMADPGAAVGNLLCGGYRTVQPPDAGQLMDDLEVLTHHLDSSFAFAVRKVEDLGPEGTSLEGYLTGRVEAVTDYGCLYHNERDEFLSGPMQVTKLCVANVEENSLRCMNGLQGCKIVVAGKVSGSIITDGLVALMGCQPDEDW